MLRTIVISVSLIAATAAPVLPASAAAAAAAQVGSRQCEDTPARQTRRSILGGLGGALAGGLLGSNRVTSTISSLVPIQSMLTDALMNMLDCDEQRKAATATEQLTERAERGGGVGTTVEWQSETRQNVRGRSTITAVEAAPAGQAQRCMTVTDVVIVDGEETTVPKRMCRTPPSTRWARAQA